MPTKTTDIHAAQQHLAELVAYVAAGTEIIILEGQTPRARLLPMHHHRDNAIQSSIRAV